MALPKYKLTYFDGRGRGEIIRLLFVAADVTFEDHRISREEFAKIKSTLPFKQIPVLEIDGVQMIQSVSIARYLARQYKLAGKTDQEQLRADILVDCFEDALKPIPVFFRMEDQVKKAELKKKYIEEQLPEYLKQLEALLVQNKGGDGFLVGDDLTWADLYLMRAQGALELMLGQPKALSAAPKLNALYHRIIALPKIAAYIAKRPVTAF